MREIPLRGPCAAGRVALVDDEDYELVMQYKWHVLEQATPGKIMGPYARASLYYGPQDQNRKILMHRLLLPGASRVDHKDRYGLNNQRSNLRPATAGQNVVNSRTRRGARSQYKGLYWTDGVWRVRILADGRRYSLGRFADEVEAALAYDRAARELFGEFAGLNFPEREAS